MDTKRITTAGGFGLLTIGCLLMAGCASGPNTYRTSMGTGVLPEDQKLAEDYRQILPAELWMNSNQIRIEPTVGAVFVTVSGVETETMRQLVERDVADFNAHHPFRHVLLTFD